MRADGQGYPRDGFGSVTGALHIVWAWLMGHEPTRRRPPRMPTPPSMSAHSLLGNDLSNQAAPPAGVEPASTDLTSAALPFELRGRKIGPFLGYLRSSCNHSRERAKVT